MASQTSISQVLIACVCLLATCLSAEAAPKTQARHDAVAAVRNLQARYPRVRALWRGHQAGPHLVTGLQIRLKGSNASSRAVDFVTSHRRLLGGLPHTDLQVTKVSRSAAREVVIFHQSYRGLVVFDRSLALTLTKTGVALRLSSDLTPITNDVVFRVSKAEATALINKAHPSSRLDGQPMRGLWPQGEVARPVWRFFLTSRAGPLQVELDAETGKIIRITSRLVH